jgi:hypothetical protein
MSPSSCDNYSERTVNRSSLIREVVVNALYVCTLNDCFICFVVLLHSCHMLVLYLPKRNVCDDLCLPVSVEHIAYI